MRGVLVAIGLALTSSAVAVWAWGRLFEAHEPRTADPSGWWPEEERGR